MSLTPGLRGQVDVVVSDADTAIAAGSGDVPVLATPRLLAMAEGACVAAVADRLEPGTTTVGTAVTMEHKAASRLGSSVTVAADLVEVDGRRLVFDFIARDADLVIGAGQLERVVVDREKFLARAGKDRSRTS